MKKIWQYLKPYGICVYFYIMSAVNFLILLYELIFNDGAEAWEYFGKSIVFLFVGLIILGFTDPKNHKKVRIEPRKNTNQH